MKTCFVQPHVRHVNGREVVVLGHWRGAFDEPESTPDAEVSKVEVPSLWERLLQDEDEPE